MLFLLVAYCIGKATHFHQKPELEMGGWLPRLPLDDLIYSEKWNKKGQPKNTQLLNQIRGDLNFVESFQRPR